MSENINWRQMFLDVHDRMRAAGESKEMGARWFSEAVTAALQAAEAQPVATTDEMVEAMAKAAFQFDWPKDTWERLGPGYHQDRYKGMIRAALALAPTPSHSLAEARRLDALNKLDGAIGRFVNAATDPFDPPNEWADETTENFNALAEAYTEAIEAEVFEESSSRALSIAREGV